jgi:hypothetical protein
MNCDPVGLGLIAKTENTLRNHTAMGHTNQSQISPAPSLNRGRRQKYESTALLTDNHHQSALGEREFCDIAFA